MPLLALLFVLVAVPDTAITLVDSPVHLRRTESREWETFPATPQASVLERRFVIDDPTRFRTLQWRQEDVRRRWSVLLNGTELTTLAEDEASLSGLAELPRHLLRAGENVLRIETSAEEPDDVRVGPITLLTERRESILSQSRLDVQIADSAGALMPGRVTIVDATGALVPLDASRSKYVAQRTGVAYTSNGRTTIHLPSGFYRIYASRGASFEADSTTVWLPEGQHLDLHFRLQKSVMPSHYRSVDPHVHTLEWSGHGDATLHERAITAAGEGLDALVLTEHNRQSPIPSAAAAAARGATLFIAGNEFTTAIGHFGVFPTELTAPAPDPGVESWTDVSELVGDAAVVVLNHGRDVHAGFAPLAPERFVAETGQRVDGRKLPANAMEVWNSSAQRSDPFELFRDWLAMAHRGQVLTPIGSSDAHDVSRYVLGQGRTWVRCEACDGTAADAGRMAVAMAAGRASASMGLVVEIQVDDEPADGERIITASDSIDVLARVWGPSWISAEELALYLNGRVFDTRAIDNPRAAGIKGEFQWRMAAPRFDASFVALARGPAPDVPFWPMPKPYQRTSDVIEPVVAGASGFVRVDADGDGSWTSPFDYARALVETNRSNLDRLLAALDEHDASVAIHAASLLRDQGFGLADVVFHGADEPVREAFARYEAAVRAASVPQMNSMTAP